MYNDLNIKKLVTLLEQKNRSLENLVWRGSKLGLEKEEVINAIDLLHDLKIIDKKVIETGDGWNSRSKETQFFIM